MATRANSKRFANEPLGYRALYLWVANENLMITVQPNSQEPEGTNKLSDLDGAIYDIVKKPKAD
jgi:D-alanyl-D-alanine carboxypeptidase